MNEKVVDINEIYMPPVLNSNLFSLNWKDLGKAAFYAFLGVVAVALYQLVMGCSTFACLAAFNYYFMFQGAIIAGVTSLLKSLLTTSDGKVLGIAKF